MEPTIMSNKEWQESVSSEKRFQLFNNLIQAMTTRTSAEVEQNVVDQANYLENKMFEEAVSRADYYNHIAQQVYNLRENANEQTQSNSSTDIEDLFANLQLSELTFEDEKMLYLQLTNYNKPIQDAEQQNKVINFHIKFWYMLLHAFECIMTNTEIEQCTISSCCKFRHFFIHLRSCKKVTKCSEYLCISFLVLQNHWTICTQENCVFCKQTSEVTTPAVPSIYKEWHETCVLELREHLIIKLYNTVPFLSAIITATYMKKIEKEIFEMANSRQEYYHLLAEKMYIFQMQAALLFIAT